MTLVSKTLQGKLKVSRIGLDSDTGFQDTGLDSDTGFQDTAGQVKGF